MTYIYWKILSADDYTYCSICGAKLSIERVRKNISYGGVTGTQETTYTATVGCPKRPHWLIWFVRSLAGHFGHFYGEMFVVPSRGPGDRILLEAVK